MLTNKLPISIIIVTYNEEKNIEDCLKSVYEWADEIIVVDSYSTDNTLDIVKKYTANIVQHPFENYAAQRNWAQEKLSLRNEWVLHLDAAERATPELYEELRHLFSSSMHNADGFLISRKSVFMGRWIRHGAHYPVYQLRLFKKDKGRCEDRLYDQHFYVEGNVHILESDIVDTITSDMVAWKSRHKTWAVQEAIEVTRNGNHVRPGDRHVIAGNRRGNPVERRRALRETYYALPLFIRPVLYYLYRYIFKCGFLDGREGLTFHFFQGFWYRFLVDTRIYDIRKKGRRTHKEVNDVIYELYGIKLTK